MSYVYFAADLQKVVVKMKEVDWKVRIEGIIVLAKLLPVTARFQAKHDLEQDYGPLVNVWHVLERWGGVGPDLLESLLAGEPGHTVHYAGGGEGSEDENSRWWIKRVL